MPDVDKRKPGRPKLLHSSTRPRCVRLDDDTAGVYEKIGLGCLTLGVREGARLLKKRRVKRGKQTP